MTKLIKITTIVFIGLITITASSCKKKKLKNLEGEIYEETIASGYTYFDNGNLLSAAAASPHGEFKLRFNSTAVSAFDTSGAIPSGGTFPDGSIVVKEVYSSGSLIQYAVMKKETGSEHAGNGWIWVEYDPDGKTVYSISKKGDACIGCHSVNPHRDLVRTFDLH